jgi:NAD-dependent DNA ligase
MNELEKLIIKANHAYYNTSNPIMSDEDYDKAIEELKRVKPNSSVLNQIGAEVIEKKVELPFWLGSLSKT